MGATEESFAALAAADGLVFQRGASQSWLTNKGHLAEPVAGPLGEHASPAFTLAVYGGLFDCAEHAQRASAALEAGFSMLLQNA